MPCPITTCPYQKSLSSLLVGALQVLEGRNRVFLEPSLLQAQQPPLSQPFLIGEMLQPSDHFCSPPLDLLQQVHVFPVLRAPELDTGLQVGSHQSRVEEQNHLSRGDCSLILQASCTAYGHPNSSSMLPLLVVKVRNPPDSLTSSLKC